jgi:hypothetical protein
MVSAPHTNYTKILKKKTKKYHTCFDFLFQSQIQRERVREETTSGTEKHCRRPSNALTGITIEIRAPIL